MNYPNLTLQIKNHIPKLIYYPEDGMSRVLTSADESLHDLITNLANELEIKTDFSDDEHYNELLRLATEGDERMIEDVPEVALNNAAFDLKNNISKHFDEAKSNRNTFEDYEDITEEVLAELKRNQNIDIFATTLEMIYNIIILKTLNNASELGIGRIHLEDENGNLRLHEKMASELSKMGITLHIN